MLTILLILAAAYVAARLYSSNQQKKPDFLLNDESPKQKFSELSGYWWFLLPIVSLAVLIYNTGAYVIWFTLELISLVVRGLQWLWTEILISGFWFVAKLVWHYLILWPWKLFKLAFEQWPQAWKRNSYIWSSLALFTALSLLFLGRYILFLNPGISSTNKTSIEIIFNLLAILPIGVVGSWLAYERNSNNAKGGITINYLKWAALIIGSLAILLAMQWLLLYAGTHTSYRSTYTSLTSAGSLLSSLLMWFNAILAIFLISALPSFSNTYQGTLREFYPEFFRHVKNTWASYMIALPVIIIPAYLITLIPLLISQGVSYMSMQVTHNVHENRITSMQEKLNSIDQADYSNWCDRTEVSADSLSTLMKKDMERAEIDAEISSLKLSKNRMDSVYWKYAYMYGALPAGILIEGYSGLVDLGKSQLRVESENSAILDLESYKQPIASLADSKTASENSKTQLEERLNQLNVALANVCPEPDTTTNDLPSQEENPALSPLDTTQIDYCELQRIEYRKVIATTENDIDSITQNIERIKLVESHVVSVQDRKTTLHDEESTSYKISYGLLSLLMALLISFGLGLVIAMFSHLNHAIFNLADGQPLHIVSEINTAKARNSNQPILGLTAVAIVFLWYCNANLSKPTSWISSTKAKAREFVSDPLGESKKIVETVTMDLKGLVFNDDSKQEPEGEMSEGCCEGEETSSKPD